MYKKFLVIVILCSLQIIGISAMKQDKQNEENQSTAYYMALLAAELSTEQVHGFKGNFEKYKQDFLKIKLAVELYKSDPINFSCDKLCEIGLTAKKLTTQSFLTLVDEEHKQDVMRKILFSAVSQGHEESVAFLFQQDVDLGDAQEEFTFLEVACLNSHQGVASMLLEKIAGVPDAHNDKKKWSLRGVLQSIVK